jgi:hypothetical protein
MSVYDEIEYTAKRGQHPLAFNMSFYADDAAFIFLSRKELIEGSTQFAHFGVTIHFGTKEPDRATSKTEAMYIPARTTTADPSVTEDYDFRDNGNFINSAIRFDIWARP